jgi:geranylgeranyl pyrophosphate synthase
MHDDVIDMADTRRGELAVHKAFGNVAAVKGGDFMIARAIVLVSKLGVRFQLCTARV